MEKWHATNIGIPPVAYIMVAQVGKLYFDYHPVSNLLRIIYNIELAIS